MITSEKTDVTIPTAVSTVVPMIAAHHEDKARKHAISATTHDQLVESVAAQAAWHHIRNETADTVDADQLARTVANQTWDLLQRRGDLEPCRVSDIDTYELITNTLKEVLRRGLALPLRLTAQLQAAKIGGCCPPDMLEKLTNALEQHIDINEALRATIAEQSEKIDLLEERVIDDGNEAWLQKEELDELKERAEALTGQLDIEAGCRHRDELQRRIAALRGEIARVDTKAGLAAPTTAAAAGTAVAAGIITQLSGAAEVLGWGAAGVATLAVAVLGAVVVPRLQTGGSIGVIGEIPADNNTDLADELIDEQTTLAGILRRKNRALRGGFAAITVAAMLAVATVITTGIGL